MKVLTRTARAILGTGMMAAVLLLSQQATAQGTDAGVVVSNQASVDYDVNGQNQADIPSTDVNAAPGSGVPTTFLVDRRVDFEFIELDGAHTPVLPGQTGAIAAFQLTNQSNSTMDFILEYVDLTPTDPAVHGFDDTGDTMTNPVIRVANGQDGTTGVPTLADYDWVDELPADTSVIIYVFADAGATLPNDAYDNFRLTASAADEPDAAANPDNPDPLLTASNTGVDDPTVIENVFANPSGADGTTGNATETADDGFWVNSAQLVVTKSATVISSPFPGGKALPDAVIEYTVTLDNTAGAADAENVVLTDTIQVADVALVDEAYGAGQDVGINAGFCNADLGDVDGDGCSYDAGTGVLSVAVPTIAFGSSSTVTYQVRISPL